MRVPVSGQQREVLVHNLPIYWVQDFWRKKEAEMQSWKEWEEKTQQPTCHLSLIDFPCRTLSHAASHAAVPHFPEAILHSAARGRERLEKWQNCVLMERRHWMELLGASDMDPKKPPKT